MSLNGKNPSPASNKSTECHGTSDSLPASVDPEDPEPTKISYFCDKLLKPGSKKSGNYSRGVVEKTMSLVD